MYKTTTFYKIPRAVSPDVDYVKQDGLSEADHSPTPKKKRVIRPKREPGATRIKSDSFCTEPPSMRPLYRSTRLSKPVDTSKNTETLDHSASSCVPKLPASNPPLVGSSWTHLLHKVLESKRTKSLGNLVANYVTIHVAPSRN